MTEEKIKEFITLALGDVADPKAFMVSKNKAGEFYVFLCYSGLVYGPKDILVEEWENAKRDNPEFKDIKLYL